MLSARFLRSHGGATARALRPRLAPGFAQPRQFCQASGLGLGDDAAAKPRAKAKSKGKSAVGIPTVGVALVVATGAAYAASDDAKTVVDDALARTGEAFEDFNDWSREVFESVGDKFVTKKQEPWLLDLATMKYPENIPTLVLDMDKVILHMDHDSRQGWRVFKRPFADQFIRELSYYYEIVIFSDDVFPVAFDIANNWEIPVTGVLHRDFCQKKRNHYVKDISKLGRSLDKVLIIDHDPAAFQLQPENGIAIKPFTGDTNDTELADLLEFLKAAASSNTDIRSFVEKFGGGDEDLGRRYLVHRQEQNAQAQQRRNVGRMFSAGGGRGGGMAGGANSFAPGGFAR